MAAPATTRLNVGIAAMAARQLRRDLRAGELRLLVVAVTLAVAALTAVGFLADRLNAALARDARALLGGDAIVGQRPAGAGQFRGTGRAAEAAHAPRRPAFRAWRAPPRRAAAARAWCR